MNLASKKLICAGVCFAAASVFVVLGKAEFQAWADFTKWIKIDETANEFNKIILYRGDYWHTSLKYFGTDSDPVYWINGTEGSDDNTTSATILEVFPTPTATKTASYVF